MKKIGLDVPTPKKACEDDHCPFHGGFNVRGRLLQGAVTAAKVPKTATIMIERRHYLRKYQRYQRRFSKMRVHNPLCISAKVGDTVTIAECRPISKTKRFVIIQNHETN